MKLGLCDSAHYYHQSMNKMKVFCEKKKVSLKWKYWMTLHATGIEIQNS
jgi:hypothetical protein